MTAAPAVEPMPITLRMLILLGVVLGMPCLALPIVLQRLDGRREPTSSSAEAPEAERSVAARPPDSSLKELAEAARPTPEQPFPRPQDWRRAETVQANLRALGASYLVLDYNPASGQFRFRCEVDLPEIPALRKVFQAQDPRPLPAMHQVLAQVQQWHTRAASREGEFGEPSRR